MLIGELAKSCDVSVQAIRFYERQGLLEAAERKTSGYRVYSAIGVRRLSFIKRAQAIGFSLKEVAEVLRIRDRGNCPCNVVTGLANKHLQRVKLEIRKLQRFEAELDLAIKQWKRSAKKKPTGGEFCALIERAGKPTNSKEMGLDSLL